MPKKEELFGSFRQNKETNENFWVLKKIRVSHFFHKNWCTKITSKLTIELFFIAYIGLFFGQILMVFIENRARGIPKSIFGEMIIPEFDEIVS